MNMFVGGVKDHKDEHVCQGVRDHKDEHICQGGEGS